MCKLGNYLEMKTKFYDWDSKFDFGAYKGRTLKEVFKLEPSYIDWCFDNVVKFCVSDQVFDCLPTVVTIKKGGFAKKDFLLNLLSRKHRLKKSLLETNSLSEEDDFSGQDDFNEDSIKDSFGQYSVTYAQDVEGLSDDFIDDALDGDPDAYWNID
jgi:hypothetical protein